MDRQQFFQEFERVHRMALQSGAESVPLRGKTPETAFLNRSHQKRFIQACHRGYEKAQTRTVQLVGEITELTTLSNDEKDHWQLLLRKIIDGIAITLFRGKSHVIRRLIFHPRPPKLSPEVIRDALSSATALNAESRLTFALLADLTTFIHVCDIVRIDFRRDERRVSMIELKSGKVNEMLMTELEKYTPTEDSIERIAANPLITERGYKSQAERMLRQKLRLRQIHEVITTDAGTDIQTKHPIRLSRDEVQDSPYDQLMNDLLERARQGGAAAGVVNYCIHIGVGFSENPEVASRQALNALRFGIRECLSKPPDGFADVFEETKRLVPGRELFKTSELLSSNLAAMNSRPFTIWGISRENLMSFVRGEFVIVSAFDVTSFIWLARRCGLPMRLSTRKQAAKEAQDLGHANIPTWGNRALLSERGEMKLFIGSGLISRFINDLSSPLAFLEHDSRETADV
jgi:hypothetical protein